MGIVLPACKRSHAAFEFPLRGSTEASILLDGQRQLGDRHGRDATPSFVCDIHTAGGKPNGERADSPGIRTQFNGGIRDAGFADGLARDGVVSKHNALNGATTRVFRASDARGGIELHFASSSQHKMDCVENRRLAGAVVAKEEQMPAFGDFNRRRPEVVELHQPHGGDPIHFARLHPTTSFPSASIL